MRNTYGILCGKDESEVQAGGETAGGGGVGRRDVMADGLQSTEGSGRRRHRATQGWTQLQAVVPTKK